MDRLDGIALDRGAAIKQHREHQDGIGVAEPGGLAQGFLRLVALDELRRGNVVAIVGIVEVVDFGRSLSVVRLGERAPENDRLFVLAVFPAERMAR